ncbi:DUF2946 family protein [Pseudomonas sp. 5P_3.1_Bac2]|uniref:DUF2946 family protein n=1 Tax=Pseudomonas sp. 5P_3.1_Bac2 TaxID=2971617 RepID=UPI0021C9BED6|nr:DUF2946 family protein [Pseudomonas sp. 5P_3.1_Bac2]MCU1719395.1 DUF2946 family protein [Pseudomonas sp. 5P_3.1_Bac2]
MNLRRTDRRLLAGLLYCSLLFSALACSIGHGQMAALKLSGLAAQFCALDAKAGAPLDLSAGDSQHLLAAADGGCVLSSVFSSVLLAALFGLLGLLPLWRALPLPERWQGWRAPRDVWPSANPRASPCLA